MFDSLPFFNIYNSERSALVQSKVGASYHYLLDDDKFSFELSSSPVTENYLDLSRIGFPSDSSFCTVAFLIRFSGQYSSDILAKVGLIIPSEFSTGIHKDVVSGSSLKLFASIFNSILLDYYHRDAHYIDFKFVIHDCLVIFYYLLSTFSIDDFIAFDKIKDDRVYD